MSGKPDVCDLTDPSRELLAKLNEKTGKKFCPVDSNLRLIRGRLSEGHKPEVISQVIDMMSERWLGDTKMEKYLRPATIFGAEKFNQYVGEIGRAQESDDDLVEWIKWTRGEK